VMKLYLDLGLNRSRRLMAHKSAYYIAVNYIFLMSVVTGLFRDGHANLYTRLKQYTKRNTRLSSVRRHPCHIKWVLL